MDNANKVLSFIDEVNKEKRDHAEKTAFTNSPIYKKHVLDTNMAKAKEDCLNYIFADLYKNSIPMPPEYVNCNNDKLSDDMKDFINRETANSGVTCYVREAIKKGNKTLAGIVESVDRLVNESFKDKYNNYSQLSSDDLDWKFDSDKKNYLDSISNDSNLNQVAKYIQKNVKAAAEYERDRVMKKREDQENLHKELASNNDITNESALQKYLISTGRYNGNNKSVYTPSLFEAVVMNKFNSMPSETEDEKIACYNEAVGEYTMLSISKAIRYSDYSRTELQNLANSYARRSI